MDSKTSEKAEHSSFAGKLALKLIGGYQVISRKYLPPSCRFRPTCSEYTRQAIVKYGFLKGTAMGAWRICRCNPFSEGGEDPVP
ncbi:MAG: membrane protein insertion efficiency factor YidD [Vulcanimicrobiota bacterium]